LTHRLADARLASAGFVAAGFARFTAAGFVRFVAAGFARFMAAGFVRLADARVGVGRLAEPDVALRVLLFTGE
jgi:hypothetical protein